jgi:hypothetical protein
MDTIKYKIIPFILLLITLLGCEDILEVDPTTQVSADNAMKNERGVKAAMNGIYDEYQSAALAQDLIIFGDLAADNLIHIGSKKEYKQISDNRIIPDNVYVEGYWNSLYDAINRINYLLSEISKVEGLSEEDLAYYKGQAYFLRAFSYFNLVKFFGGVPLREEPVNDVSPEVLNIGRASENETYTFIHDDLDRAESFFEVRNPETASLANLYAVKALRARVSLYREQWTEAYVNARQVINSGEYGLLSSSNYAKMFQEKENDEVIFQIDFSASDDVNAMADWTQEEGRFEVAAWDSYDKESSIADEYKSYDIRKDVTVAKGLNHYYCDKYNDLENSSDNIIHFRLAEMYLICAEALNETGYVSDGPAFDYLNAVHQRAGLDSLTSANLSNQSEFRDAIHHERRLELAFEGHRYFDLVRTDRAADVLGDIGTLADNNWLFPIPQSEIDVNQHEDMTQNGDY